MARRTSFLGVVKTIARESARLQREAEAARRRQHRDAEAQSRYIAREAAQLRRESERESAQAEKAERQRYLETREAEVADLNTDLHDKIDEIRSVLDHTLHIDDTISFDSLLIKETFPEMDLPIALRTRGPKPVKETYLEPLRKPSGVAAMLPGAMKRYQEAVAQAEAAFSNAVSEWSVAEEQRLNRVASLQEEHEKSRVAFEQKKTVRAAEVAEFQAAYTKGDPEAVVAYCNMVLERSEYPEGFPQEYRLAYTPESRQLVIEYELPGFDVVPKVGEYRHVKAKDEVTEKARKVAEVKDDYQDLVAAVALRTIHEALEADQGSNIDVVCFNGFVQTVDPATGQDIRPHLISVRTTKERFLEIDLSRVDRRVCLRNLGATVSSRPAESQAVKPVVEFDMVDRRFVDQSDVLADLESRPNLMDLNPFEFENLVANLFEQMGLDAKLTRSSRDGGVDCVAFDPRPILGGKVVIQAKRYKNTVGVSAARDLFGTMMNEGASKGILVTTSGYGPDTYEFCKDKPIELIDGGGLLYLLQQTGIEARIVFPED